MSDVNDLLTRIDGAIATVRDKARQGLLSFDAEDRWFGASKCFKTRYFETPDYLVWLSKPIRALSNSACKRRRLSSRASSSRLRSLMSRALPSTPTTRPYRSR